MKVDSSGVEIKGRVSSSRVEELIHRNQTTMNYTHRTAASPDYFCYIGVTYQASNGEELNKIFRLEDESICQSHSVGDTILGKYLPKNPEVFVLDEGRVSFWWLFVTLGLSTIFLGGSMLVFIRIYFKVIKTSE